MAKRQTFDSQELETIVLRKTFGLDPRFQHKILSKNNYNSVRNFATPVQNFRSYSDEDFSSTIPNRGCLPCSTCSREPNQDSVMAEYLTASSMHGLKYVAEPKRHLTERIFWIVSFALALATSAYLISVLWSRYLQNPVIIAFQPREKNISDIPFPAVTICDMNVISKDAINKLNIRAKRSVDDALGIVARENLRFIRRICREIPSFAKFTGFASKRGVVKVPTYTNMPQQSPSSQSNAKSTEGVAKFLLQQTIPCDEMIHACSWAGHPVKCNLLFKPTITDTGKCCTFNTLPPQLSLRPEVYTPKKDAKNNNPVLKYNTWTKKELKEWSKWDYSQGYILPDNLKRPRRQTREGAPYGLSFLADGNVDKYFCTSTDSLGFKLMVHSPQERPQMSYYGIAVELGKETYIDVQPHLTIADPSIESFTPDERQCIYSHERPLEFYLANNYENCLSECTSKLIYKNCSCFPANKPKALEDPVCSSKPDSKENLCAEATDRHITSNFRNYCNDCLDLCSELRFTYAITSTDLQNSSKLWMDHNEPDGRPPDWAGSKMSLVHVYFSVNAFVPRVRQQLYGMTDLIGDTGNVLSLCLGFSILSALEILYFCSCRILFRKLRNHYLGTPKNPNSDKKIINSKPIFVKPTFHNIPNPPTSYPSKHNTNLLRRF